MTDFDMIRHGALLGRRDFSPPLELLTLVDIEFIIPVDWLASQIPQVRLPSDQVVNVLDDIGALLSREVLLTPEKVVSKK